MKIQCPPNQNKSGLGAFLLCLLLGTFYFYGLGLFRKKDVYHHIFQPFLSGGDHESFDSYCCVLFAHKYFSSFICRRSEGKGCGCPFPTGTCWGENPSVECRWQTCRRYGVESKRRIPYTKYPRRLIYPHCKVYWL